MFFFVLEMGEFMKKEKLANEIMKMCKYFEIIKWNENQNIIKEKIIDSLNDIAFIENLLNIFYQKAKLKRFSNSINRKKLKLLLTELEIIRLNLELGKD